MKGAPQGQGYSQMMRVIGRPVTYYPTIAQCLEDVKTAIFICNFIYWEGKQDDEDGWIYKRRVDITRETGLSRHEQDTARKRLRSLKLMEEQLRGTPPKMHYRFDWQKFEEMLAGHFNSQGKKPEKPRPKKSSAPQEDPEEKAPILAELKEIFDEFYLQQTALTYEWSKGRVAGKDWKNLKNLKECFAQRLKDKKKNPEYCPSEEELKFSFREFLQCLPDYHRNTNLTPALLYSNFNKIVLDIRKENGNRKKSTSAAASRAADYIGQVGD